MTGQFTYDGLEEFFHAHGNRQVIVVSGQGIEIPIGGTQAAIDPVTCCKWLAWIDELPETPEWPDFLSLEAFLKHAGDQ